MTFFYCAKSDETRSLRQGKIKNLILSYISDHPDDRSVSLLSLMPKKLRLQSSSTTYYSQKKVFYKDR